MIRRQRGESEYRVESQGRWTGGLVGVWRKGAIVVGGWVQAAGYVHVASHAAFEAEASGGGEGRHFEDDASF